MATLRVILSFALCIFSLLDVSCSFRFEDTGWRDKQLEGRYTRDIDDYELLVPRKVDEQGAFVSHVLPNFYRVDDRRRKRDAPIESEKVHYGIQLDGEDHVVELWPNQGLLSPGMVVETRQSGPATDLSNVKIRPAVNEQCHYIGRIKGQPDSRVALSTCDGVVGHIRTKREYYYIEPVKDHEPKKTGEHLHLVYKRSTNGKLLGTCGTHDDWEKSWSNRLKSEYSQRSRPGSGLAARSVHKRSVREASGGKSVEEDNKYMEVLLVADKKFLQARNGTDYEQYLLTAMNMASDIMHDESIGHPIDLVLVRIMYLEKEEEEIDLTINKDADATLLNFCNWSTRMNPVLTHPNHHDVAILITKYDICLDEVDCGTTGLATVGGCCGPNVSCAICEDMGLVVGTVIAHEIGHLLGAAHDSDEDNPPEGECPGAIDQYNIHVMASWSQMSPANWSTCSRKYITEFFESGLGTCLLDEPQDHNFKFPDMPPGVLYDREWQCNDRFGPTKPCDMGPERNCKLLSCAAEGTKKCRASGPPADGTSCGHNKWCFDGECVEVGVRPGAVNGQWGEWGSWSECSRTCGGGASFIERQCDSPRPGNRGRYCVGQRRRYKLCNTEPCDENASSFREQQCAEHNEGDVEWIPFNDGTPESACQLVCSNNKGEYDILQPRVKDGTPCGRGSTDTCIAGKCRHVGCDWNLESDAVEDVCGVCNGDASTCDLIDKVYTESGEDYQEIVTIPAGARHVMVEEMKPSSNALALSAADKETFYLNGDYTIEADGETKIGSSIMVYTNEEPDKETLFIAGPTEEDLILYILNNGDPNPGIHYKYSVPSTSSSYKPKFSWELVDWGQCSVFCGGGTQLSDPSCIEERGGKVSKMHCEQIARPETGIRACNTQPCKVRWRVGEWGQCSGCEGKSGYKQRVVDCAKQSPYEDSEHIAEDFECEGERPANKESCSSDEPCAERLTKRHVSRQRDVGTRKGSPRKKIVHSKGHDSKVKAFQREGKKQRGGIGTAKKGLVVDRVNPKKLKVLEIPMTDDVNNFDLSDEAFEAAGDVIASPIDTSKIKVLEGEEALKALTEGKKRNEEKQRKRRKDDTEYEDEDEYEDEYQNTYL